MSVGLRVAVFCDVHGNLDGLLAVLDDISNQGPFDFVIAGGDYCVKGPDPVDCFDLTVDRADEVLIGNTDHDLIFADLSNPEIGRKKRVAIEWARQQLGEERLQVVSQLAFKAEVLAPDGSKLIVVHANPQDLTRHIFPDLPAADLDCLLHGIEADVLVFGHLHIPYCRRYGELQLFDVASSGLPQDGDRRVAWGSFEWSGAFGWRGTIHRVEYDYGATVLRMIESGMPHPIRRIRDLVSASYA